MSKKTTVVKVKVNRSAETGQFVTKKFADKHPATTETETIKKIVKTADKK